MLLLLVGVMQAILRKIGNSKGVIIPSAFIEQLNIKDSVEIQIDDGAIILKPVQNKIRQGWFDNYQADADVVPLSEMVELESEQEDWQW